MSFPQVAGPLKYWFSPLTALLSESPFSHGFPVPPVPVIPLGRGGLVLHRRGREREDPLETTRPIVRDLLSAPPLPGSRHRMAHSTGHLDVSGTPARPAVKRSAVPGGVRIEVGVCDHNLLVLIDCDSHSPGAVSLDRDSSPSPHLSTPLSPYGPVSLRAALAASSDVRSERCAWLLRAACRPRRRSSERSLRPRRRARLRGCGVLPPRC